MQRLDLRFYFDHVLFVIQAKPVMEGPEAGMIVNEKFVLGFALKSSHVILF